MILSTMSGDSKIIKLFCIDSSIGGFVFEKQTGKEGHKGHAGQLQHRGQREHVLQGLDRGKQRARLHADVVVGHQPDQHGRKELKIEEKNQ